MQQFDLFLVSSVLWVGVILFLVWIFWRTMRLSKDIRWMISLEVESTGVQTSPRPIEDYIATIVILVSLVLFVVSSYPIVLGPLFFGLPEALLDLNSLYVYSLVQFISLIALVFILQKKNTEIGSLIEKFGETRVSGDVPLEAD